jgi:site-specific recombinase XerD
MNKISFVLKSPNARKSPLLLRYNCEDDIIKYPLGLSIQTSVWDKENQLPISSSKSKLAKAIKDRISVLENRVEDYCYGCKRQGKKVLKTELQVFLATLDGKLRVTQTRFFDQLQELIRLAQTKKITIPGTVRYFTDGTLINWKKTARSLREFDPNMCFEGITKQTYQDFINFCNSKGYSLNYTGSLIKDWKALMNHSLTIGYHNSKIQDEFDVMREQSTKVYLSEADIEKLKEVRLNGVQDIIRDRFILGLRTGLRISDWKVFEKEAIIHNGICVIPNRKTRKEVAFPLPKEYFEMMEKYHGKLPKQYNKEYVNREIKKIARKAGITEPVLVKSTIGGHLVTKKYDKCDLISNHTGRRSAVSLILKEHDSLTVESLVGMSAATVRRYDKRTKTEIAEAVKTSKFYNR